MKLNNISIKWKLFGYLFLFVIVMLAMLWVFQTMFLDSFYKNIKTNQITGAADTIEENIDSESLNELIERLQQETNAAILLLDENGQSAMPANIHANPQFMIQQNDYSDIERLLQAAENNGGTWLEASRAAPFQFPPMQEPDDLSSADRTRGNRAWPPAFGAYENITYIKTAAISTGETRHIFLNARISPVNATVETLRVQLIYISIVLVVMAFVLALMISQGISKPIMQTNAQAKKLAAGDYGVLFINKGYREISELNATLSTAAFELSRVEELRRELIANVSHDLRTPLTMITGFAEMIRDLPGENTPENAQVIVDESNRLTRLVSDLLDLSKLQAGAEPIARSRFCITSSLFDTIARIVRMTGTDRITCEAQENVWVEANEIQILQVIYNLLTNALTHSVGPVIVRQETDQAMVRVEVVDCGEGIAAADLPYVWERYYKVDKSHKRAIVGTGLGLSIVKGIVSAHEGRYGVESTVGAGSAFWFELPVAAKHDYGSDYSNVKLG